MTGKEIELDIEPDFKVRYRDLEIEPSSTIPPVSLETDHKTCD